MRSEEIAKVLSHNVGKMVVVTREDGRRATVRVNRVDEEGFTSNILDDADFDPAAEEWWAFYEIMDVRPE
jgi:hypothetical protein